MGVGVLDNVMTQVVVGDPPNDARNMTVANVNSEPR